MLTWSIKNVNLTCICAKMYFPHQGQQRFCLGCGRWHHEKCMQAVDQGASLQGENDLKKLSNLPIVRGWGSDTPSSWELTGSGKRIAAVKEWLRSGKTPDNWEAKLNEKWVYEVLRKMWARYKCPDCGEMV